MADGYRPPEGSMGLLIMGVIFTIFPLIMVVIISIDSTFDVVIFIPLLFVAIGVAMILLAIDVRKPNGKFTTVKTGPGSYTIVRRKNVIGPSESYYEGMVNKDQPNANGAPTYNVPDYSTDYNKKKVKKNKKANANGVYSYMNCPHCGSLNEVGNNTCRSCGKKL